MENHGQKQGGDINCGQGIDEISIGKLDTVQTNVFLKGTEKQKINQERVRYDIEERGNS